MGDERIEQIRAWESGELHPEHATFSFAHGFGSALVELFDRLETENRQLRAGINGTDWENDLLANAPDWLDDDVAQSEIVSRYVRWLEAEREALREAITEHRHAMTGDGPRGGWPADHDLWDAIAGAQSNQREERDERPE